MKPSESTLSAIPGSPIKIAAIFDEAPAVDVLVRAFASDPVIRWTWPELPSYVTHFPSFVQVFGGKAFAQGSAYYVDGYAGVALWLPPAIHPDEEALSNLLQRTVSEQRQRDLFAVFEEMDRYHPSEPHWYLPLIGIDPSQQSQGYGSALMRHALMQCDRDQTLAYLESTSVKSIPFYQRHGFKLLGTIQVGTSPPLFPMLRKPR
ncbi:MAG: GNAT family N-acetyltransferase [Phormidesmis sp.]